MADELNLDELEKAARAKEAVLELMIINPATILKLIQMARGKEALSDLQRIQESYSSGSQQLKSEDA